MLHNRHSTTEEARSHHVARAWMALWLLPFAFGGAFLVGEGLNALFGYPPGGAEQAPPWVIVLSTLPAFAVFAVRPWSRRTSPVAPEPTGIGAAYCPPDSFGP